MAGPPAWHGGRRGSATSLWVLPHGAPCCVGVAANAAAVAME
eukprot:CAMPEP_0168466968 /NCGR_PEP_ID=MMETSP0228-20121227/56936_1 /TAXON_ID=133427 /ORGANISM="Protoceratium reticulatum, Strain CCCM 535 (=CCMP 1889)" /LENGTH=41 /DNA_ID= /DNA_START= /DNA_END= /DNA_ORIENTATION=